MARNGIKFDAFDMLRPQWQEVARKYITPHVGIPIEVFFQPEDILRTKANMYCVERKYDGERMQIHVLDRARQSCLIFSKSKRDSTVDRADTHPIIFAALRGTVHSCVLEAEMITVDVAAQKRLPFHRLREHGKRKDPLQQLFIVFFDVIVHNGESLIFQPLHKRRALLDQIIRHIEGRAATSPYAVVSPHNVDAIMKLFYHEVVECHEEGLMLKDWTADYYKATFAKMKRDYVEGMRENHDWVVLGGWFDRRRVQDDLTALNTSAFGDHHALMTHLIIGAVEDQADISRGTKPTFKVLFAVETGMTAALIKSMAHSTIGQFIKTQPNPHTMPRTRPFTLPALTYHVDYSTAESDVPLPEYLFTTPLVAELYGAEISKPPNRHHYTLRHPRIKRIRTDVQWTDCMSFAQVNAYGRQFGDRKGKVTPEQRAAMRKWAGSMVDDEEVVEGETEGDKVDDEWMVSSSNVTAAEMSQVLGSTQMTTQRAGGWSSSIPVPPIMDDGDGDDTDVASDAATEIMDMDVDEEDMPCINPMRAMFHRAAVVQQTRKVPVAHLAGAHVMVDHLTDAIVDKLVPVIDEYRMVWTSRRSLDELVDPSSVGLARSSAVPVLVLVRRESALVPELVREWKSRFDGVWPSSEPRIFLLDFQFLAEVHEQFAGRVTVDVLQNHMVTSI
ncbi:hypothetical protein AMAG_19146 [Allomyces macrogynus ATCC 38327]|uniref:ATP-dependent DNA ligase family profile domain-containing protein n=1 Tax=Allomyces macrogynus (strain ATCC 38327) TaxID=578462 RepID=A0A0L0SPI5_ALLM3|nr:hypothetical protein AMAG_19146 [Allomyces macrogynus ATCC 38327]|eukprot:KNE64285.1 hypothetical protein AMAG_19146 [Allomyces macrogynus ATCC 38327]